MIIGWASWYLKWVTFLRLPWIIAKREREIVAITPYIHNCSLTRGQRETIHKHYHNNISLYLHPFFKKRANGECLLFLDVSPKKDPSNLTWSPLRQIRFQYDLKQFLSHSLKTRLCDALLVTHTALCLYSVNNCFVYFLFFKGIFWRNIWDIWCWEISQPT